MVCFSRMPTFFRHVQGHSGIFGDNVNFEEIQFYFHCYMESRRWDRESKLIQVEKYKDN